MCKTSVRCVNPVNRRLVCCQMYVVRGSVSVKVGVSGRIAKYLIVDSVKRMRFVLIRSAQPVGQVSLCYVVMFV